MRRHQLLVLLALLSIPIRAVWAQSKPIKEGPYYWTGECGGEVEVNLTVSSGSTALPGLYTWDYELSYISRGTNANGLPMYGISNFHVYSPADIPELDHASCSAWPGLVAAGASCVEASSDPGDPLPPRGMEHLRFTMAPRVLQSCAACGEAEEDGPVLVSRLLGPRRVGELARAFHGMSDGGLGVGLGSAGPAVGTGCQDFDDWLAGPVVVADWRLAVRAGMGEGPDKDDSPQVKVLDDKAVDNQGRLPATFPLGAKFWVQLVKVDPDDPTHYEPLEGNSQFTLSDDARPDPAVQDSLFPNNVVIEYASDAAENFKYLQAVHLGTVTLTITPTDQLALPVTVAITVNRPASLGTTWNYWDPKIVTLAHQRGIPPQVIKGQIQRESGFDPVSYRYEPLNPDVGDMFQFGPGPTGQNLRVDPDHRPYILATDDRFADLHSTPWPAPGPKPTPVPTPAPQLQQGAAVIPEDIAPRSTTHPSYLMCAQGLITQGPDEDYCVGNHTVPIPASDSPYQFISAREIIDLNDELNGHNVQHWQDEASRMTRGRLRANWNLLNFTAQTSLAASYGLLHIMYLTAVTDMDWPGVGGKTNPSYLFDTDARIDAGTSSLPLGVAYLRKRFLKANGDGSTFQKPNDFIQAFKKALGAYSHSGANGPYANDVVTNAGSFMPVPSTPMFPGQ